MPDIMVLRHDDKEYRVELLADGSVRIDGSEVISPSPRAACASAGDARWVFLDGETYEFRIQRSSRRTISGHAGALSAPMPATVLRVNVTPGESVRRGDTLIVLEAMKMELPLRAPADAVVEAVHCREGELVQPGSSLIELR